MNQKNSDRFFLFLTFLFITNGLACSTETIKGREIRTNAPTVLNRPYVVLVSIDGYRYDYTDRYQPPHLKKLRSEGVAAESLLPVFPSKTFTNHYSIATGLYPENHGIVANSFYDPIRKSDYTLSNPKKVKDGTWYQGEPLWVSAEKQGMLAATYFWPGSEAAIHGIRPSYFYEYDEKRIFSERIQQIKEWLELSPEKRPHFITLYFSNVDAAGHQYGPHSQELKNAVLQVDQAIGALVETLNQFNYDIHLIVLSDHGMQALDPNQVEFIDQYTNLSELKISGEGPISLIYVKNEKDINKIYYQLKSKAKHFKVYKRKDLPNSFHYKKSIRSGDLILIADAPYSIGISKNHFKTHLGDHGYDPDTTPHMEGIFYAKGPLLKNHLVIKKFRNIQIYPFIMNLLKLQIQSLIDGDDSLSEQILKPDQQSSSISTY